LHFSPVVVMVVKSRRVKWIEHKHTLVEDEK